MKKKGSISYQPLILLFSLAVLYFYITNGVK